jgi:hypothetical protein
MYSHGHLLQCLRSCMTWRLQIFEPLNRSALEMVLAECSFNVPELQVRLLAESADPHKRDAMHCASATCILRAPKFAQNVPWCTLYSCQISCRMRACT